MLLLQNRRGDDEPRGSVSSAPSELDKARYRSRRHRAPNRHEAGRAHVVVYNRDMRERAAVGAGSALSRGDAYEVRDAQNFFGEPVARGTFDGSPIQLPLMLK
ncbi:MAG TPA: hypothetical protein VIP46_05670 [Pyrinomonadaceae bacterium]